MKEYFFYTKGLTVGYRGVPLIHDIEIGMRQGEILTLIGPNGAGKTTILKNIIRQLSPLAGTVYLDGENMARLTGKELAQRLSVVLTERVRPELMSCGDVVATGRYPYTGRFGVLTERDREIVKEAMDLVHIQELAERDFGQTSDGQKQRVMLARALCQQPDILVLDEPTSFLDIRYKLEFLTIIQRLARERKLSVVMSLHELDLAERISDKIACVCGDCVDRFGTPEEIFTEGYIPRLYGMTAGSYDELTGSPELERTDGRPRVFVLGGCGTGTPVYRRLQREAVPFATGILWENDLDYPAAAALAAEVVSERPYRPFSDDSVRRARSLIDECDQVICTTDPDEAGELAEKLRALREYAEASGKLSDGRNYIPFM